MNKNTKITNIPGMCYDVESEICKGVYVCYRVVKRNESFFVSRTYNDTNTGDWEKRTVAGPFQTVDEAISGIKNIL